VYVLDYLADPACERRPGDALCADYRLLCSGSIYRRTEGEWYKSEGARFLLDRPFLLYAASRPFEEYPLELVLRLTVARVEETSTGRDGIPTNIHILHPDEEVARDLAALLTVLCRRLITVSGKSAERFANYPYPEFDFVPFPLATSMRKVYWPPHPADVFISFDGRQEVHYNNPIPKPLDPGALTALLLALPKLKHAESIVASARLYALGLELIGEQPDIAYQLLISSVETIANQTLPDFQPDDAAKVKHQQAVFNLAMELYLGEEKARALALAACKTERWATRKFKKFVTDNLDDFAWEDEDDLYRMPPGFLRLSREHLQEALDNIYRARSKATHAGQQFPVTASYSGGPRISVRASMAMAVSALAGSGTLFPPVVWFERIVNTAIRTFWERSADTLSEGGRVLSALDPSMKPYPAHQ
jgi:hypothetical protein